jgi:curved DNA-binding protein CbpA
VLVQKYHPDRHTPREEAERITKRLNEAYAVLSDPHLRATHDEFLSAKAPPAGGSASQPPPSTQHSSNEKRQKEPTEQNSSEYGWRFWLMCLLLFCLYKVVGVAGTVVGALVLLVLHEK